MKVLAIQNCAREGFGCYESRLREMGAAWDRLDAWERPEYPAPDAYDMVIVGGTPDAAYDEARHPYLTTEMAFLGGAVAAGVPCFGICCGAQLLAKTLGADVRRADAKEIGCYEVALTPAGRADPLLQGFADPLPVFQWHGDTFDIPEGASRLASSAACPNQMFRLGSVVGVQFHLEVSADEAGKWARAYTDELRAWGGSAEDIVAACRDREPEMRRSAELLIDRFVGLHAGPREGAAGPPGH